MQDGVLDVLAPSFCLAHPEKIPQDGQSKRVIGGHQRAFGRMLKRAWGVYVRLWRG